MPPVSAPANGTFDPTLAPLLYATPEVEVLYGGPHGAGELRPAASTVRPEALAEDEPGTPRRREYHF